MALMTMMTMIQKWKNVIIALAMRMMMKSSLFVTIAMQNMLIINVLGIIIRKFTSGFVMLAKTCGIVKIMMMKMTKIIGTILNHLLISVLLVVV